jgi:hypothetical protein
MTGTDQGWYPDPGGQADLRWWDGQAWTAHTRAHPSAPPVPAASAMPTSAGYSPISQGEPTRTDMAPIIAPTRPPTPPPGSFGDWGQNGYAATAASATTGPPRRSPPKSLWMWVAIGAAVAVAVAVVAFLAVSVLDKKSTPSSTGLIGGSGASSGFGASTTTAPSGSGGSGGAGSGPGAGGASTTAPSGIGTGSGGAGSGGSSNRATFTDPTGLYSITLDPSWVSADPANGIKAWTIPGATPDQPYGTVNILTQNLPEPISLSAFTQAQMATLSQFPAFHIGTTTTITLADGTPATIVTYTSDLIAGQSLAGEATFVLKGLHAAVVTLTTQPDAPDSTVPSANAYIQTFHLN